ncbi:related to Protein BCP1 [Hanseniaspora guilliermondii]|uniref:Protein BCP1 n=1 Tax=Hanseniaspora guilliermondii TaxID=56406 RepID=A0A1L0B0A2_9ASCO|nr:related to Protein BCP1 [Hanseniaspora guilliermondii]
MVAPELSNNRKRKNEEVSNEPIDINSTDEENQEVQEDGIEDDEQDIVNVDFDVIGVTKDPNTKMSIEQDFHSVKSLLRQILGSDASLKLNLSKLADSILEESLATNFIKCDGQMSDPYCFLSFVSYNTINKNNKDLMLVLNNLGNTNLNIFLDSLKTDASIAKKTCFVFSERFINMPHEVVPPLYSITIGEMMENMENIKKEEINFYIIMSRKYEINFDNDDTLEEKDDQDTQTKKTKHNTDFDFFHLEDQFFEKNAKIQFEGVSKKGILPVYYVLTKEGLEKSLLEVEQEISSWN